MNFYTKVGNVLRDIETSKISFKTAIYNYTSYEGDRDFKKVYKLVMEVLRCKNILKQIVENFFQFQDINNLECFMVLCYERFFSDMVSKKKIGGKLMRMIKEKEYEIRKFIEENYKSTNFKSNQDSELMYFRVNRQIKENTAINFIISNKNNLKSDEIIDGLYSVLKTENDIVKKIFEFKNSSEVVIQTKSSALPAYLLKLISGLKIDKNDTTDVIDSCSAPGNKTLQLSEYFSQKSKIFAFEIDPRRFQILKKNVEKNNFIKNINLLNEDFLKADPTDKKFANVKVILSDPSCSGSGTFNNSLVDDDNCVNNSLSTNCCLDLAGSSLEKEKIRRLTQLAKFQIKILEHCMKFPKVKYISFSTCSIFMTENEFVVNKVLKKNKNFRLFDIFQLDQIKTKPEDGEIFHKGLTEETEKTLRTCRLCHKIDGFYVAIFERIE